MRPRRLLLASLTAVGLLAAIAPLAAANGATVQTVDGTVRILVVDDLTGGPEETRAAADVGDRMIDIPAAQAAGLRSGDRVSVTAPRGARVATAVHLVERAPVVTTGGAPATASATSAVVTRPTAVGVHSLTLLPVYWSAPDPAAPLSTLTALASGTAEYWSQQSGGRIAITPTVRDWVKIADPGSCNQYALSEVALAAHGVARPTSPSTHVMIYFPRRSDCGGWAGLGEIGRSTTWINGYPLLDVAAHEFGHNLGLGHANTATCSASGTRVTLAPLCSVGEYRDYADVMGIAMDAPTGSLNTALGDALGIVHSVTAAPGTRTTVDLAPLTNADAVRAVKVRLSLGWLYVDYRPAAGRDVRMPGWAGVQAHYLPDGDTPASQLLDGRPSAASPFATTSLPVGVPWSVPGTNLIVTVASVTATSARVDVGPAVVTATTPPRPTITAPAAGAVIGAATTVSWRAASKVASVRLLVDGRQVAAPASGALSGNLAVTGLTGGRHTLTLQGIGAGGEVSALSAGVSVTVDALPPSTPTALTLSAKQVLGWRASSDATSGVAGYLVSMDGGTPTRLGAVTAWTTRTPVGRHTWWVAAIDRVGNVSPAAGLVVVRSSATTSAKATTVRVVSAAGGTGQRTLVTGRTVGASRPL